MKKTVFVIALAILIFPKVIGAAELDQEIVVTGIDETLLEVPPVMLLDWPELPALELDRPGTAFPLPLLPPWGDWLQAESASDRDTFPQDLPEIQPMP
jgi:hypothetical protein